MDDKTYRNIVALIERYSFQIKVKDPDEPKTPETETPVVQGKHEKKTETAYMVGPAVEDADHAEEWQIPHPETGGTATLAEIIEDLKDAE